MTNFNITPDEKGSLTIRNTLIEAWKLIHGAKWAIWAIALMMFLMYFGIRFIIHRVFHINVANPPYLLHFVVIPVLVNLIVAPLYTGIVMTAIIKSRGKPVDGRTGYQYFHHWPKLAMLMAVIWFVASLFEMLVHIPAVLSVIGRAEWFFDLLAGVFRLYVIGIFSLSLPLAVEHRKSFQAALRESFQATLPHSGKILVMLIIAFVSGLVASSPLMLGFTFMSGLFIFIGVVILIMALAWIIPFSFMVLALIYRQLV